MSKGRSPITDAKGAPVESLLFVDAVEGDTARVLLGVESFAIPRRLLPEGAREGTWVRISIARSEAPPDDAEAIRKKLGRDDDGGDIKL